MESPIFDSVASALMETGAIALGAVKVGQVEEEAWDGFLEWLRLGHNAEMKYMENHQDIRRNPCLLLEGAESIISIAFPFKPPQYRDSAKGMIACYAYGSDYHDILRRRLQSAVNKLEQEFGGKYRICIDSAPIMERYWAVKAGIGSLGENGSVIVGNAGNMCFLAEIITTLRLEECKPIFFSTDQSSAKCNHCGNCRKHCPAGAILRDGTVDSNRCLSYLTIEHRGEWTLPDHIHAMETEIGKNTIFGCDICLRSCHLNKTTPPTEISEFNPRKEIMTLSKEDIKYMEQTDFSAIFKGSAIKRCKLSGLKRNVGIKSE